ncbi:RHS repeat-associated core domain-containing protein [Streptomyces sp. NPDC006627]|uniref:RHS repeat-associated core domain-containing protein n=1 Tax=Streptomyces sp. NPDC006627 TaxID=3154679 RepID=UPI0033B1CAED
MRPSCAPDCAKVDHCLRLRRRGQTKAGADTYGYDPAGQISAATVAGASYTYDHDASGNQVTATKDGTVTSRTQWDPNGALPILATEYDSDWKVKQSYRYDPLGRPTATRTGGADLFFYHHDTQGSPIDVTGSTGSTGSTGTLHQRWAYDPYGTRVLGTVTGGAPASTPSYTGARYEASTGNLYLHSRQDDTTTGRFTRPDPATRDQSTPYVSPYAYAYADNAPTLYTDPSGLTPVPGDDGNGKVDSFQEGARGSSGRASSEGSRRLSSSSATRRTRSPARTAAPVPSSTSTCPSVPPTASTAASTSSGNRAATRWRTCTPRRPAPPRSASPAAVLTVRLSSPVTAGT